MKSIPNNPVVLTGRVFVHGALEDDFPYLRLSRCPQAGDMRMHAHLDAEGRQKRACGHCQAGYSGVLRASVYDGRNWRKFMLAPEVDVEDRHFTQFAYRAGKAQLVIRRVSLLKGMTCSWRDGAYVINRLAAKTCSDRAGGNAGGLENMAKDSAQNIPTPITEPEAVSPAAVSTLACSTLSRGERRQTVRKPQRRTGTGYTQLLLGFD